ncbi:hypothetical protein ACWD62_35945 [Streptomyces sp. NPDC005146]
MLLHPDRELRQRDAGALLGGRDVQLLEDLAVIVEAGALAAAVAAQVGVRNDQAGAGEANVAHP